MDWTTHFHSHKHPFAIAAGIVLVIVILAHWLGSVEPVSAPAPSPTSAPVVELRAETEVVAPK
jgi:hypothetical protein